MTTDERITPSEDDYARERRAFWAAEEAACRAVGLESGAAICRRWADYWALAPADRPEVAA